ncbi:MAG TPA: cytochrome B [Saprospiraceae bacterium]|nr:cytochrome B [Saprospiraceae bacterium]
MYSGLVHAHSGLRWIFLILILITLNIAVLNWLSKKPFWTENKKWALFTLIAAHLQLVIGLILYFISPKVIFAAEAMKDSITRFYLVEHVSTMIIGILFITIGYSKAKRQLVENSAKTIVIYYGIGLLLILSRIPWPGSIYGSSWF